jgi:hypothetical protein
MLEVAARPEFEATVERLREIGYEDAEPRERAMEIMGKALAGDPAVKLTDAERESLAWSFLTAVVEEKGQQILANLPETGPLLWGVIGEIRRGYDYGEQYHQRNEAGGGETARGVYGPAGEEAGKGNGPGARDAERGRQRADEGAGRGVPEKRAEKGELTKEQPAFQRRAPKPPEFVPLRGEPVALPGMEDADEARRLC